MAALADQYDLPSDSDDSDADFKPSGGESLSEEDSDGSVEEPTLENDEEQTSTGKRKKKQTKRRKKIKKKSPEDDSLEENPEELEEVKKLTAEEEKKKADRLWSDFMKDVTPPVMKKTDAEEKTSSETKESQTLPAKPAVIEKAVVKEIFEFAGEKIEVEKEVPVQSPASTRGRGVGGSVAPRGRGRGRGGGGLASLVGQLGKKNKLSTLEKSKLDWDRFKKAEGIEEQIQTFNKGKEGFLEKQDFLQRTDLRQFEIEKQLRTTTRSNR